MPGRPSVSSDVQGPVNEEDPHAPPSRSPRSNPIHVAAPVLTRASRRCGPLARRSGGHPRAGSGRRRTITSAPPGRLRGLLQPGLRLLPGRRYGGRSTRFRLRGAAGRHARAERVHPVGARYNRWWAAYTGSGTVYLPLVMADSGHQYGNGPVSYYSIYKGYLDAELARPAGAELAVRASRVGNRYRVSVDLVKGRDRAGHRLPYCRHR